MNKFQSLFNDFKNALLRFEEILREKKTDIIRDSAIKRFEIVFDLTWKTIKAFLEKEHNIICVSPKTCFREAFRVGLIDYDEIWIKIADDRNYTAHTYKELLAEKIYAELPQAFEVFQKIKESLEKLEENGK